MKPTMALFAAAAGILSFLPFVTACEERDIMPANIRRDDGEVAKLECHSACGNAIAGASDEADCADSAWRGDFDKCVQCAEKVKIWDHYKPGVAKAAQVCGLKLTEGHKSDHDTTSTTVIVKAHADGRDKENSADALFTSSSGAVLFAMLTAVGLL